MLMMILKLLLGLSIIVFIHELGHFLAAKLYKVRVEKFYLFFDLFGKKLFSFKKNGTEFGIGWFPLGGYVKMSGMVDESMDTEQLAEEPKEWEYRSKPAWQRLIILSAGVILNFILGFVLLSCLAFDGVYIPNSELKNGIYAYQGGRDVGFVTGDKIVEYNGEKLDNFSKLTPLSVYNSSFLVQRGDKLVEINLKDQVTLDDVISRKYFSELNYPALVDTVQSGSIAEKIGLRKNDLIVKLDTMNINSFGQLQESLQKIKRNSSVPLVIERSGVIQEFNIELKDNDYLGVIINNPIQYKDNTFIMSLEKGLKSSVDIVYTNAVGLKLMIVGKMSAKNVSGPIGIARIYGDDSSLYKFISITAMLSILIGFMNILPIPGLDGGHIFIILVESLIGRKLGEKSLIIIQWIGVILILSLMIFAVFNDIMNLIG